MKDDEHLSSSILFAVSCNKAIVSIVVNLTALPSSRARIYEGKCE